MDRKRNINRYVEEILNSTSNIKAVKTPPFFKDKVLNKMAQVHSREEYGVEYLNWFTPKYHAAVLVALVIINTVALLSTIGQTDSSYVENVEKFAEVYGLSETDTDSYLYQN